MTHEDLHAALLAGADIEYPQILGPSQTYGPADYGVRPGSGLALYCNIPESRFSLSRQNSLLTVSIVYIDYEHGRPFTDRPYLATS